jgi:hypothetical protein
MEPEVHLIEKYFQIVWGCFTMANVPLRGGKEIDLLAINPITKEKFHVEAMISLSSRLRLKDTYTPKGRPRRIGLDYFIKEKFFHPTMVEAVNDIFGLEPEHQKVLVVWGFPDKSFSEEARKHGLKFSICKTYFQHC